MIYRSVGNLCAVDFTSLGLIGINDVEAMHILTGEGFAAIDVNIEELAYGCVGVSSYKRGADPKLAPETVDCSSFVKWLYSQKGVWLPRHSIDQRDYITYCTDAEDVKGGDLIFTSGVKSYYWHNRSEGVGHVGFVTSKKTVIHAANSKVGVIETELSYFTEEFKFRGARRPIPDPSRFYTLVVPHTKEVEWSQQLRWTVLQHCEKVVKIGSR